MAKRKTTLIDVLTEVISAQAAMKVQAADPEEANHWAAEAFLHLTNARRQITKLLETPPEAIS